MTLDYTNPNDWGRSPLTDSALRLQQFRAENPEKWDAMIEEDLNSLTVGEPTIISPDPLVGLCEDDEEPYPPFSGQDFIDNHESIDDHPYAVAFGQFLGNGIDPDTANLLAFGDNRFDLISDDFDDPLRQTATRIYGRLEDLDYWSESGETDSEPEGFSFG